jgi:hypothetical protein
MIEPYVDLNTRDIVILEDGEIKMNEHETAFQDFWGEIVTQKGSDVFDDDYGIPYDKLAHFGRIPATDKLLQSYILEKAEKYNIQVERVEIQGYIPDYEVVITYKSNDKKNTVNLTL